MEQVRGEKACGDGHGEERDQRVVELDLSIAGEADREVRVWSK